MSSSRDTLREFSQGLAEAVQIGAQATVLVNAREGYPASGVAYKPDRVLTSNHAVQRDDQITVALPDGKEIKATLAGRDPGSDLALLRLEEAVAAPGTTAEEKPEVGQLVLALARPTDEGIQASLGVVGIAGGRYQVRRGGFIEGVMRTDAAAFPGFAGGPLIDTEGRILGINTFGFRFGTSLTVTAERAWEIAEKLEREGTVKRGYLGIRSQRADLPDTVSKKTQETGLLIVGLEKGSPADKSGLLVGDILTGIDGAPIEDHDGLLGLLRDLAGKTAKIELARAGKIQELNVEIGEAPETGHYGWAHGWSRRGPHHRRRR
jgi:S1-C subfamily serine protease